LDTIYGLKIDQRVNHNYFTLAQELRKLGCEFAVIELDQLMEAVQKQPITWLILFTANLDEAKNFDRKIKQNLRSLVGQEKLGIIQFTSFSSDNGHELQGLKTNYYQVVQLPLKTAEAANGIVQHIEKIYRTMDGKAFKNYLRST
jgi:hypothetical protein